jgi:hypothetical protein
VLTFCVDDRFQAHVDDDVALAQSANSLMSSGGGGVGILNIRSRANGFK